MDPLGTIKKFHACSRHIGEDFWPANENCLFSDATKPKTTCSFLTIFSSCICISIAAFQTSFNFTVYWFFFWKILYSDLNARKTQQTKLRILGENLNLNIFKVVRKTFKKDLHCANYVYFKYITTLLRSEKNFNFCSRKKSILLFPLKKSYYSQLLHMIRWRNQTIHHFLGSKRSRWREKIIL